jgi:hypothetical protein
MISCHQIKDLHNSQREDDVLPPLHELLVLLGGLYPVCDDEASG